VTGLRRLVGTTAFKLSVIYMLASAIFAGGLRLERTAADR
jgi:hypothetical protein